MGLLSKSLGFLANIEDPSQPLLPNGVLWESFGLGRSEAGVLVNEKQALRLSAVYACCKIISEDLGRLPLCVYQRLPDGSMREAVEHPIYTLLHDAPNPMLTAYDFRRALVFCALLYGNGYAHIVRDGANRVKELRVLQPDKMSPVIVGQDNNKRLIYVTTQTKDGTPVALDLSEVLHIRACTLDGINGLSPIAMCRNTYGLAIATESFGAKFFGNGARATGVLTHPETLGPDALKNLQQSFRDRLNGDNSLSPLILEEGMKWEQLSVNPDDAQFLQTRQFQNSEIAREYRVPLHMLQDLARSTNNNIEHQGIEYVKYCLAPWAVNFEQQINKQLLRGAFMAEHNMNELARGDFASQTTGFATLRNWGIYSVNDALRDMRRNPISDEEGGNARIVPLNMQLLEKLGEPEEPGGSEETPDESPAGNPGARGKDKFLNVYQNVFRDAVGRTAKRKPDDRGGVVRQNLSPAVESLAAAIVSGRFECSELTDNEKRVLDVQLSEIERECRTWTPETAKVTARAIAGRIYDVIQGGLS